MGNMTELGFVEVKEAPGYWLNKYGTILTRKGAALKHYQIAGYQVVSLAVGEPEHRKRKTFYVHRLIAEYFLPKPRHWEANYKVQHKNRIKTDLSLTNLMWMSPKRAQVFSKQLNGKKP